MAAEHLRAERRANAFVRLELALNAAAGSLQIEPVTVPKLVGAANRDADLVQIGRLERVAEFLEAIPGAVESLKPEAPVSSTKPSSTKPKSHGAND